MTVVHCRRRRRHCPRCVSKLSPQPMPGNLTPPHTPSLAVVPSALGYSRTPLWFLMDTLPFGNSPCYSLAGDGLDARVVSFDVIFWDHPQPPPPPKKINQRDVRRVKVQTFALNNHQKKFCLPDIIIHRMNAIQLDEISRKSPPDSVGSSSL